MHFIAFAFVQKKCVNGTFYEETCENGLVYDGGYGAVYNFCNYNWAVDCGKRVYDDTAISSPGCLYQFGLYPVGVGCQTTFYKVRGKNNDICTYTVTVCYFEQKSAKTITWGCLLNYCRDTIWNVLG